MKKNLKNRKRKNSRLFQAIILLSATAFTMIGNKGFCQDKKGDTSKVTLSMSLSYKKSDEARYLKVNATQKVDDRREAVSNLKTPVVLYLNEVKPYDPSTGNGLIGSVCLNDNGDARYAIPADINSHLSGLHEFKFIAKLEHDPLYEDDEEDISITDAKIKLEYSGNDSVKTATATLIAWKDSAYVPIPDAEVVLSIKRSFNPFPFTDDGTTTDSTGKVSATLPINIPGDGDGTITIIGSITDNDSYGSVETTLKEPWSVLPKVEAEAGRTLWANQRNAPLVLVFASCSIVAAIWGTLIFLVSQLFKIRKIGKQAKINKPETVKATV